MAFAEDLLGVSVSLGPGRVTLGVSGEVDSYTAEALRGAATTAMEPGVSLIVDLGEVTFIDSVGLGTLLSIAELARGGDGEFVLQRPPPSVRRVLEISGLIDVLPVTEALRIDDTFPSSC